MPSQIEKRSRGVPPIAAATRERGKTGRVYTALSHSFGGLLVLCLSLARPCQADELAEKGKAIFKKNQHAVVTVELVLKNKFSMSGMGGQSNESRQDATGTVVDPSGLTVMSLSATDPSQLLQNMMSGGSDEESRFKMETELSDVKILLEDGSEIPAEVILRDR